MQAGYRNRESEIKKKICLHMIHDSAETTTQRIGKKFADFHRAANEASSIL